MKLGIVGLILFAQSLALAAVTYPLQLGIGTEYCYPDKNGLKNCMGESPRFKEVAIPLHQAADSNALFGHVGSRGEFREIGYEVYVQVARFNSRNADDMVTLRVTTWNLKTPENRNVVISEVFANSPKNLNRILLRGMPIGNNEFYTNITLGLRPTQR